MKYTRRISGLDISIDCLSVKIPGDPMNFSRSYAIFEIAGEERGEMYIALKISDIVALQGLLSQTLDYWLSQRLETAPKENAAT